MSDIANEKDDLRMKSLPAQDKAFTHIETVTQHKAIKELCPCLITNS